MVALFGGLRRRTRQKAFLDQVFVHSDALYRYAVRLTGDEQAAEDLVQESFAKAFKAFDRLRADTNHRAWVFTILRNTWLSHTRKAWREAALDEPGRIADPEGRTPHQQLVGRFGGRHSYDDVVLHALDALPEAQRTAVVLCDVEGMSYDEIAEIMGCPVGTVRSRIHHGRSRLRGTLREYARARGIGAAVAQGASK